MRITLTILTLFLFGCANAWQDLGDGKGMRGWAGVPLKDTMPMGMALAGAARSFGETYSRTAYTDPYLLQNLKAARGGTTTIISDGAGGGTVWGAHRGTFISDGQGGGTYWGN